MRLVMIMLSALMLFIPFQSWAEDLGLARVSHVEGDVQVKTFDGQEWEPAELNMPLGAGDRIYAGEGARAELQIKGGVSIRFDQNTSFEIMALDTNEARFYLDRGHAYINNLRGGIKIAQVDTPTASCNSYDNSIMLLDVAESGITDASSLRGYLYVEARNGKTRVAAGKTMRISETGSAELAPLPPPDEWERWNLDRDRNLVAWSESSRYLPEELHEYSADLDRHGSWTYVREYGYIWAPTVIVRDWSPYRHGRWRWMRNDYVWVPLEPWGWAPCHFGRWVFINRIWYWVPPPAGGAYWGPGYVGWTRTDRHVAWVPLAPGEVYYGRGNFGPHSVNVINVKVNETVNRKDVYVHGGVGVTAVHLDQFARGAIVRQSLRENPFASQRRLQAPPARIVTREPERIGVGQPRIKVEQKTPAPQVERQHPVRSRPPETERKPSVDQIRNERSFARGQDQSVYKKERPAPLPVRKLEEPRVIIRHGRPLRHEPQGGKNPDPRGAQERGRKETGEGRQKRGND